MRISMLFATLFSAMFVSALPAQDDPFKREGTSAQRSKKDPLEGKPAPPLEVVNWLNIEGKTLSLKELRGKVVVLDFWGVWCSPCRAAIPHLKELHEKYRDQGLVIIGVHTTSQGGKMKEFVRDRAIAWPVAVDVEKKTIKAFKVDSYPDYYLIDRKGILRVADLANKDLDNAVEILIKEKAE